MASRAAAARLDLRDAPSPSTSTSPRARKSSFQLKGPAGEVVEELVGGLRSGMSYVGAARIPEFWERAGFIRQTEAARKESAPGQP